MTIKFLLAAMAAALTLTACASDSGPEWRDTLDCSYTYHEGTEELFAQDMWGCVNDGVTYSVYEFADEEARDNWRTAAEGFGAKVVSEGDDWLAVVSERAEVSGDRMD